MNGNHRRRIAALTAAIEYRLPAPMIEVVTSDGQVQEVPRRLCEILRECYRRRLERLDSDVS